jgi:haloalkane dehalogenase/tRNA(adenine34) deaminase
MNRALRTPDERFLDLPGFPYTPRYLENLPGFPGLRMHHLDEGRGDGPVFLCVHGQPTWSYLYRKMLPVFGRVGRVIAPDLFGFGRSDKPVDDAVYTFDFHRRTLIACIEALDLVDITLVCQDWGGLLGLTLPMDMPARFSRLIVMDTAFPTGDQDLGEGFRSWRAYNRTRPDLDVAALLRRSTPTLTDAEAAAYAAPFPDVRYKAGVRRFPELVPDAPDAPGAEVGRRARDWFRDAWRGDAFMAIGAKDTVIPPKAMRRLHAGIRGCREPLVVEDAGHFVQEWGEAVAEAALSAFFPHPGVAS